MRKLFVCVAITLIACSAANPSSNDVPSNNSSNEDPATNDAGVGSDASRSDTGSISCPQNTQICGPNCISIGSTCCASVGLSGVSCPNGGVCHSDGICTGDCKLSNHYSCTSGQVYSCTGPVVPTQTNSNLKCSTPTVGIGETYYCCVSQCSPPNGTYQYVWTTLSGNCGDIKSSLVVFNSSSNLLYAAETAELAPSNSTMRQINQNIADDACSGSVSSAFDGNTVYPNGIITGYDVVQISSNQNGTQLMGSTSLQESGGYVCAGTYSFVATRISP